MPTNYPLVLDTSPSATFPSAATLATHDLSSDTHGDLHDNLGKAVVGLENQVGIVGSTDPNSLNYRIGLLNNWTTPFTTLPALAGYGLTNPGGNISYATSVVSGKLRVQANAAIPDSNARRVYALSSAGTMGNSEIKSTWSGTSATWDALSKFQFGHAHRINTYRQQFDHGIATANTTTTLTDSTKSWATNAWAGPIGEGREYFVGIVSGTGFGQNRMVNSNTGTVLTLQSAWTTTPDTTSRYEIFAFHTRAVTLVAGVAFALHEQAQSNAWDGANYTAIGATDLGTYLKPGGTFKALPWFVKSKLVENTLSYAYWTGSDPEPSYTTSGQSGSVTIPAGWEAPGMAGLYAGHLDSNDYLEYDNLTITRL